MKEGVTLDFVKIYFNRDKLTQELKTTSRWLLTLTRKWWSYTKWDCFVFPNLISKLHKYVMLPAPRIAPIAFGEIGEQNTGSFEEYCSRVSG
jgi:hypothetical protein